MLQALIPALLLFTPLALAGPLLPAPESFTPGQGSFTLDSSVAVTPGPGIEPFTAQELARRISSLSGVSTPVAREAKRPIRLVLDPKAAPPSGYTLEVRPAGITLTAASPAAAFHGSHTLLQLLDPGTTTLPSCRISDAPRFAWRGLMLDSSRHFQSVDEIKRFIDQMAHYKFNVFHWHLTDDQGWRIEIKSRPKLTSIGAWRVPREGIWWFRPGPTPEEKPTYGGFYTQEQIREVVRYAADRHITIIPEIDVPGHSLSILAAYPELSTTGGPFLVNPGSQFYGKIENTLDPSNPETFRFLDDVFREVASLFPAEYIHMGGDECPKNFWAKDPDCQALMKKEGLKNPEELQSWFVRKVEAILHRHKRKLMGWDEILEGGLADSATVMSWRGKNGGIEAARLGRRVVMSPSPAYYLDLYQGHPEIEPATYNMARLKDTFSFDPTLPAGLDSSLLLGIQGNVWTEEIPNFRHVQYMTWPRAFAIAEEAWTKRKTEKNWPDFVSRVESHFRRFDSFGWHYARSIYDPAIGLSSDGKSVVLTPEIDDLDIHYTFDDTEPDHTYPRYEKPLPIPVGASHLRTMTYRKGQPVGRTTLIRLSQIKAGKRTP